jgi:hypothetical protein
MYSRKSHLRDVKVAIMIKSLFQMCGMMAGRSGPEMNLTAVVEE